MSHAPRCPKGTSWLVICRRPNERALTVEVEHDGHGLTAYEAWVISSVPSSFSETELIQLDPYPLPPSVNTKQRECLCVGVNSQG